MQYLVGYFKGDEFVELSSTNDSKEFAQFIKDSYVQTVEGIVMISSAA